jgi:superfamily II DNA helicase RecQ
MPAVVNTIRFKRSCMLQAFEERDMTAAAQDAVRVVRALQGSRTASVVYTVDVYRGASHKTVRNRGHDKLPEHGLGKSIR